MTQELRVPDTGSTVELTLDNAILGVREVRNKGASFCPACGLALATPEDGGWRYRGPTPLKYNGLR